MNNENQVHSIDFTELEERSYALISAESDPVQLGLSPTLRISNGYPVGEMAILFSPVSSDKRRNKNGNR